MLKVVYIHRRSSDTNLAEIHEEMSELLDKQVYILNECSNRNSRINASPQKVYDEEKMTAV